MQLFLFQSVGFEKYATALLSKDSLCWVGIRRFIRSRLSVSIPNFVSLISLQIPFLVKCWRKKLLPEKLLIRLPCRFLGEKGKLYWLPLPAFTNYGVLDGKNAAYLFRILSQMGGFPIVRTEGYMKETAQVQMSPFAISFRSRRFAGHCT